MDHLKLLQMFYQLKHKEKLQYVPVLPDEYLKDTYD